jgi:NADH:ubiquinone oxidoreductase subunit
MGVFKNIFTWWEGATFGTWINTQRTGVAVGDDLLGNRYYEAKREVNGRKRRWVIYNGSTDASRIPPDWHSWIHGTIDDVPSLALPEAKIWETAPVPNLTGSASAYRPAGTGSKRALASGDYQAWSPDNI